MYTVEGAAVIDETYFFHLRNVHNRNANAANSPAIGEVTPLAEAVKRFPNGHVTGHFRITASDFVQAFASFTLFDP